MQIKNYLKIFLTITLVCSITPVMALENAANNPIDNPDDYRNYMIEKTFNAVNEACNAEITPEQDKYLEEHEKPIIAKSELMFDNLQNYLNYLQKESNEQTVGKRDTNDKFAAHMQKMLQYLLSHGDSVRTINCNTSDLLVKIGKGTYKKEDIIVQINDGNYIRYVRLIDLTDDEITLKIYKNEEKYSIEDFIHQHESDRVCFNIIIVDKGNIDNIMGDILEKQRNDLDSKISEYTLGMTITGIIAGSAGLGVTIAGCYRCSCCNIKETLGIIHQTIRTNNINNGVELVEERKTLIREAEANPNFCKRHNAMIIIVTGLIVTAGAISGLVTLWVLKSRYETEKNNLNRY